MTTILQGYLFSNKHEAPPCKSHHSFFPPLRCYRSDAFTTSGCYQLILITEIETRTLVKNELRGDV